MAKGQNSKEETEKRFALGNDYSCILSNPKCVHRVILLA